MKIRIPIPQLTEEYEIEFDTDKISGVQTRVGLDSWAGDNGAMHRKPNGAMTLVLEFDIPEGAPPRWVGKVARSQADGVE